MSENNRRSVDVQDFKGDISNLQMSTYSVDEIIQDAMQSNNRVVQESEDFGISTVFKNLKLF